MNFALAAALVSGLCAAGWQAASPGPQTTEQVEEGRFQVRSLDLHSEAMPYRIRLLPVSSFPDLPEPVAAQLHSRGCMIPQTFEAQAPENVIHGSFRAPGSSDWAALCSVGGATTLYVFLAGQFQAPVAVRTQPDTAWLGAEPGGRMYGSAWGISVRSAANLRSTRQLHGDATFDHDGIEDAHLETSADIRYFQDDRWLSLGGPP
jgi:hypothetical protein